MRGNWSSGAMAGQHPSRCLRQATSGSSATPEFGQGNVEATDLPSRESWNDGSAWMADEDQTVSTLSGSSIGKRKTGLA